MGLWCTSNSPKCQLVMKKMCPRTLRSAFCPMNRIDIHLCLISFLYSINVNIFYVSKVIDPKGLLSGIAQASPRARPPALQCCVMTDRVQCGLHTLATCCPRPGTKHHWAFALSLDSIPATPVWDSRNG